MLYFLISLFMSGIILIGYSLFIFARQDRNQGTFEDINTVTTEHILLDPVKSKKGILEKLFEPGSPYEYSEVRKNLMQAGWDSPLAPFQFTILKLCFASIGGAIGILLIFFIESLQQQIFIIRLNVFIGFFATFYLIPIFYVKLLQSRFRRKVANAIPDALDLMLVCVESGQSIDKAILRVARDMSSLHPELAQRFDVVSEALKAGADRADTFFKLAYETDNEDLRSFAAVVMQSISFGAPISETFRVYSSDLRDQRIRRIEEKANKLPTKMTLGTMLFTIPPLMMLLLAPAVARILSVI